MRSFCPKAVKSSLVWGVASSRFQNLQLPEPTSMLFADFWHAAYHGQAFNQAPVQPLSPLFISHLPHTLIRLWRLMPSAFFALYLKPQLVTVYVAIPIREAHRSGQDTYVLLSLTLSLCVCLSFTLSPSCALAVGVKTASRCASRLIRIRQRSDSHLRSRIWQ